jgi:tRNA pseudouridine55 synthase
VDGVIHLYKPVGVSSAQYAYRLRGAVGTRRVGHAGTLDPFAEGVLVVCVGRGTKLVERLMGLEKLYRAWLRLGVTNETFDPERPFEPVAVAAEPGREEVERVVEGFVGVIAQVPPQYSAVKVGGRPAYRLAARGQRVELRAKEVQVYGIEIIRYEYPLLELVVRCGRGTYIRALARDIGAGLGTGACCERLVRLAVGPFRIEDAVRMEACSRETVRGRVLGLEAVERMVGGQG